MHKSTPAEFFALSAIWGSSFLFMRLGGAEFGAFATAGARVAIGAAVLVPVLWFSGHWKELSRNAGSILVVGVLNSGLPFALFAYAVLSISTGLSGILNATVPLFGALIAWAWLGDRLSKSRVLGIAIGFAGVVMLAADNASFKAGGTGWAVLACLAAATCYGVSASFTKKYLTAIHPLAIATGSQLGATLALALPTIWFWPSHNPGLKPWLAVITLGVLCTAAAYILFFRLIARLGPARAVTVTYLLPVFAVFYGTLFLGEKLTGWMLLCGLVIVCGTALSSGLLKLPFGR